METRKFFVAKVNSGNPIGMSMLHAESAWIERKSHDLEKAKQDSVLLASQFLKGRESRFNVSSSIGKFGFIASRAECFLADCRNEIAFKRADFYQAMSSHANEILSVLSEPGFASKEWDAHRKMIEMRREAAHNLIAADAADTAAPGSYPSPSPGEV